MLIYSFNFASARGNILTGMLEQAQEYITKNPMIALGIIIALLVLVVYLYFREGFSGGGGSRKKKSSKKGSKKSIEVKLPEPDDGSDDDAAQLQESFSKFDNL